MAITFTIDGTEHIIPTLQDVLDVDNRVAELESNVFNNQEQIRLIKQILNGATPEPPVYEGITVGPEDNIQEAIMDANGQQIWKKNGFYKPYKLMPNTRLRAMNPNEAIVDGTIDWSDGWVKGSNVTTWYKELDYTFYQHPAKSVHTDNGRVTARGLAHREAMRPQMLLWKGKVMQPVFESKDIGVGTFMLDGTSQNPKGIWAKFEEAPSPDTVRLGVHEYLVKGMNKDVDGVELDGITFQHCANTGVHGGLDMDAGQEYWKIRDCDFLWTMSEGARLSGKHHLIERCRFNHNGHIGMALENLYKSQIIDCETNYNVWRHGIDPLWHGGGFKAQYSVDECGIINHKSFNNNGAGGWFDINNNGSHIINPMFDGNMAFGLHIENGTRDGFVIGGYIKNTRPVDLGSRIVQSDLRIQRAITGYTFKDIKVGHIYYKKDGGTDLSGHNIFDNVDYDTIRIDGSKSVMPDQYLNMPTPVN